MSAKSSYPTSHEDELAIIGCCLYGGLETSIEAIEAVKVDAFSRLDIRDIFSVIEILATEGKEINPYTLLSKCRELGKEDPDPEVLNSPNFIPSAANLPYHIKTVNDMYRKRHIMHACYAVFQKGKAGKFSCDDMVADLEKAVNGEEITETITLSGKEAGDRMIDDLERRFQLQGALSGVPTGLRWFDQITDGIQYGEQTIVAARPSQGKTALGLGIAVHACFKNKIPTMFVSLEMSIEALMRRLCSCWSEIGMSELKKGSYTQGQFESMAAFRALTAKAHFWITDAVNGMGINQLCAAVRRRARKDGVKLVVIDYLQKIKPDERHEKRTYEVGSVSTSLKALATSTGVALLTLAQINRESEKDKGRAPRLADLADSSQIERDADTVAMIHRKRNDPTNAAQLIIAKQRDGETGLVDLIFNGKFARFENPIL